MPQMLLRGVCALGIVVLTGLSGGGCSRAGGVGDASDAFDIRDPQLSPPLSAAAEGLPPDGRTLRRAQYVGNTAPSSRSRELRVMSFNIRVAIFIDAMNHWGFRKGLLVETIRSFSPDLLGTQEALASQSDYLRENLREYGFVGVGRNDGRRRGEMCGVFFKLDRFDKLDEGHFWLSDTPSVPGSKDWGSAAPRMVTWVKLRDRSDGHVLCFFNTHFDHRGRRAREESAKLLRQKVAQIAGGLPVIITGDFNTDENTPPYRTLVGGVASASSVRRATSVGSGGGGRTAAVSLVDTFRAYDGTPDDREGTRHSFGGGTGGPRIDWILASPAFTTVHAAIDHTKDGLRYPSDHFPVTAVLRPSASLPMAQLE